MATERQIESARRNGAKSKGPVTPEGKARSSRNSLKHGLAAAPEIVMETENDDSYDRLLEAYMDTYKPATGEEYDLVCQIVSASWRLRRISRMEAHLLDAEMNHHAEILEDMDEPVSSDTLEAKAFRTLAYPGRSLALVIRYATSTRRIYDAAVKSLRDRQRERAKTEKQNEPDLHVTPLPQPQPSTPVEPVAEESQLQSQSPRPSTPHFRAPIPIRPSVNLRKPGAETDRMLK